MFPYLLLVLGIILRILRVLLILLILCVLPILLVFLPVLAVILHDLRSVSVFAVDCRKYSMCGIEGSYARFMFQDSIYLVSTPCPIAHSALTNRTIASAPITTWIRPINSTHLASTT